MFEMSVPWWEPPLRAVLVYVVLLAMVRLSGKRSVGQFTPFDLLVVMLLSESVSNALGGEENSVQAGLLAAATLVLLNAAIGFASTRSRRIEEILQGHAVLLGKDGTIFHDRLKRHRVGEADMEEALREADIQLHEMDRAFLEPDGTISVTKKRR